MTEKTKKKIRIKFRKEFAAGKQNRHIDPEGNIVDDELRYYWEQRPIYNITGCLVGSAKGYLKRITEKDNNENFDDFDEIIYDDNGLVDMLIPCQRSYNALKGRYAEYINRLSTGVIVVEDGSADIDELAEDGFTSGKVIVYRQGSVPPTISYTDPKVLETINEQCDAVYNEMLEIVRLFILRYCGNDIMPNLANWKR
jgi:hypothetical protein